MNKVILIGNLTRDPETRYSQSAEPVAICRFTLAINKRFKREGESDADFINCVALGKTGENIEKFFKKGRKIAVVGRLSVRPYEDQGGQKKTWTEVVVDEFDFIESAKSADGARSSAPEADDYYQEIASGQDRTRQKQNAFDGAPAGGGFQTIDESLDDEELPF